MSALTVSNSTLRRPLLGAVRVLSIWQVQVVLLFALSRVVTTAFLAVTMHFADPSAIGTGRTLLGALVDWDGVWYQRIAADGYPTELPLVGGNVQNNAWAFLPLYPLTVKTLILGHMSLYRPAAVLLSCAFGAAAALMLVRLVRPHVGQRAAVLAAVLFSFGPTSYILQSGYAESLGLFLLFALLYLVDGHRYVGAALVALPLAFARPGMQAVALFLLLHAVVRVVRARHEGLAPALRMAVAPVLVAVLSGALGFVWPLLAGWATGTPDAYLLTELSWRVGAGFDPARLTYFMPWIRGAIVWFGMPAGPIILVNLLIAAIALPFLPFVRRVGTTVRLWYASYLLYLLAVFFPQSSTLRLLMPVTPVAAGPLGRLPGWQFGLVLVGCVSLQGLLVWNAFGAQFGMLSTP